jgi:MFS family permease
MHSPGIRHRVARHIADARSTLTGQTQSTPSREARTQRKNFVLHVMNGSFIGFAEALSSPSLVMTAFLSQLTTSNLLIGLLSPLRDAGWFLPQFFLAPYVDRARRKVSAYRAGTTLRFGSWVLLVVSVFVLQDRAALLAAVFACTALFSIMAGFAGLPYMIITAKVIPPHRRGLVFGLRQFIGGGLGIAAGGVVTLLLSGQSGLPFPQNYAVVFLFATVGYALSYLSLSLIEEQPDDVPARATPLMTNLRQAWVIARGDQQYQRYMAMRVALLIGTACIPFLTVYATRALKVSDAFIGSLVSVTLASSLLSNVLWARLSDRRSNRLVMLITTAMGAGFCAAATLAVAAPAGAMSDTSARAVLIALFAASGAMTAGMNLVALPLMIEVAPAAQQSLYFGLSNTLLGVVLLLTSLVGVIVDRLGFAALFIFCGLAFAVALERLSRMRDPRERMVSSK